MVLHLQVSIHHNLSAFEITLYFIFIESVYAANRTAKKLNLPVSNINHLILEALAFNENVSCTRINEIITNAYSQATDNDFNIVDGNFMLEFCIKPFI